MVLNIYVSVCDEYLLNKAMRKSMRKVKVRLCASLRVLSRVK